VSFPEADNDEYLKSLRNTISVPCQVCTEPFDVQLNLGGPVSENTTFLCDKCNQIITFKHSINESIRSRNIIALSVPVVDFAQYCRNQIKSNSSTITPPHCKFCSPDNVSANDFWYQQLIQHQPIRNVHYALQSRQLKKWNQKLRKAEFRFYREQKQKREFLHPFAIAFLFDKSYQSYLVTGLWQFQLYMCENVQYILQMQEDARRSGCKGFEIPAAFRCKIATNLSQRILQSPPLRCIAIECLIHLDPEFVATNGNSKIWARELERYYNVIYGILTRRLHKQIPKSIIQLKIMQFIRVPFPKLKEKNLS
jgi:hypothetical protein